MKNATKTQKVILFAFLGIWGFLNAATLPDSTPVPELCGDLPVPRTCPENFGQFEITDSIGNPVHKVKKGDYILLRYIEPPEGTFPKPNQPGRDFHLISPDLDGTGPESWVLNSVVRIFDFDVSANILFSDDIDFQAPDRVGPADRTFNPPGKRGWQVWHGETPFGPGTLYQKTLKLESIPENQANRWLFMDTGFGQQWPLSFQQNPLLTCGPGSTDKEEYEVGDTVTVTVQVSSRKNLFTGSGNTYTDVTLTQIGAEPTLRLITGPSPTEVAILAPDTTQDFVFSYEALEDGPANLQFQAKGLDADGDAIFSSAYGLMVFVGGKGDLIIRNLHNSSSQVLEDDVYTPDTPTTLYTRATTIRGGDYIVSVQNEGMTDNSFYLKLAETDAAGWKNRYLVDGIDVSNELTGGKGLLISDLAAGAQKDVEVFLKPGSFLEECSRVKGLFTLALAKGNNEPMDALIVSAEFVDYKLESTLAAEPVAESPDLFELTLEVKNRGPSEATNVSSRIPTGSSGDGTFEFVGNTDPSFFPTLASGDSATFKRTVRRLTPGEITIKADARATVAKGNSTRAIYTNEASVELNAGVTLEVEVQPQGTRQKGETFMARVTVKSTRPDPQEITFFSPFVEIEKNTVLEAGEALPPGTFTLTPFSSKAVFDIPILAKEPGASKITTRCMVTSLSGTENLEADDTAVVSPLKITLRALPLINGKPIVEMELDEEDKVTDTEGDPIAPKVEVTFENLTEETVTTRLQSLDPRARDKNKVGARLKVTGTFPIDIEIPKNSKITKEFPLVIKDDGRFEFTAIATATTDGKQFNLVEKGAPIAVGGAYPVEIEINVVRDPNILQSGRKGVHKVNPGGTLKLVAEIDNRTTNSTLSFYGISSKKERNALGGVLTTEDGNLAIAGLLDNAPPLPVDHIVESGEHIILTGEIRTDVDGPGSGSVEFLILQDGKLTEDVTEEVETVTLDDILFTGDACGYLGNDLKLRIIQDYQLTPRRELTNFETVGIYTEATFVAAGKWMYDSVDMIGGVGRIAGSITANPSLLADYWGEGSRVFWEVTEMVSNTWTEMTPEERQAFIDSAVAEVQRRGLLLAVRRVPFDAQDVVATRAFLERATYSLFGGITDAYATNDPAEIARVWGTVSGNIAPEVITAFLPTPNYTRFVKAAELSKLAKNTGLADTISVQEDLLRLLKSGPIDALTARFAFGMGGDDLTNFQKVFKHFQVKGYARERAPISYKLIDELEEAIWKPEAMKPKSMSELDRIIAGDDFVNPLTVPGKDPDNNPIELNGLVAIFNPGTAEDVARRVRAAGYPDEVIEVAQRRADLRRKEWNEYPAEFKKWKKKDIPVALNYVDNGAIAPGPVKDAKRPFDFVAIERPGKPTLYVPKMADDAGELRYISGDIDWVHFSNLDGTPLDPETAGMLYAALSACCGFQHPETVSWILKGQTVFDKKANQLFDYVTGGKALLEISEFGPRAVRINEALTRFVKNGRSHLIFFDNGVKSRLRSSLIDFDSKFASFMVNFPRTRYSLPFYWGNRLDDILSDNTLQGREWSYSSGDQDALILRDDRNGGIEQFDGTKWIPFILKDKKGGTKDNDEELSLSPASYLNSDATAGSPILPATDLPNEWPDQLADRVENWFEAGQKIIIAPGEITQEIHLISAVGETLTTVDPLIHNHPEGTFVAVIPGNMVISPISDLASTLLSTRIDNGRAYQIWRTLGGRRYALEESDGTVIREKVTSQGDTTVVSLKLTDYDADATYQLRNLGTIPDLIEILSLEQKHNPEIFTLTWTTTPGRKYQVESMQPLESADWENVGPPVSATIESLSIDLPITQDVIKRFYRVRESK